MSTAAFQNGRPSPASVIPKSPPLERVQRRRIERLMTDNRQSGFVPISIPVSLRTGGIRSTTPGLRTISSCREHHRELLVLRAGSSTPRSTLQTAICTHESRRDPGRLHRLHGVPGTTGSQAHRARVFPNFQTAGGRQTLSWCTQSPVPRCLSQEAGYLENLSRANIEVKANPARTARRFVVSTTWSASPTAAVKSHPKDRSATNPLPGLTSSTPFTLANPVFSTAPDDAYGLSGLGHSPAASLDKRLASY